MDRETQTSLIDREKDSETVHWKKPDEFNSWDADFD